MLGVSSYGPVMSVDLPAPVVVRKEELMFVLFCQDQNERLNMGRRMGMLTVMMPTRVSRTPHSFTARADG